MIKYSCERCGERIEAPENMAGRNQACPKCQCENPVPDFLQRIKDLTALVDEGTRLLELAGEAFDSAGAFTDALVNFSPPFPVRLHPRISCFEIDVYFVFQLSFAMKRTDRYAEVWPKTMTHALDILDAYEDVAQSKEQLHEAVVARMEDYRDAAAAAAESGESPVLGWATILGNLIRAGEGVDYVEVNTPFIIDGIGKAEEVRSRVALAQVEVGDVFLGKMAALFEGKDFRELTDEEFSARIRQEETKATAARDPELERMMRDAVSKANALGQFFGRVFEPPQKKWWEFWK